MHQNVATCCAISCMFFFLCRYTDATNIDGKIKIRLYKEKSSWYDEVHIEEGHTMLNMSASYNKVLPVVLIIHGMSMGANSGFVNGVVDAFVKRRIKENYNILSVDMPELFDNSIKGGFYIGVLRSVQPAGKRIGRFLNDVISLGLTTPENINILGYSIGAQVAGYVAREVKEVFGKINYIAGLDPAGPGFHALFGQLPLLVHVSRDDANTTHFLHSNSVVCGTRDRGGTADFIFNNGDTQPGCFRDAALNCSHVRVRSLYIEAIVHPQNFVARLCPSWTRFSSCQCDGHKTASITFPPDIRARGVYYLRTRASSPLGLRRAGSKCRRHTINKYNFQMKTDHGLDVNMMPNQESKHPQNYGMSQDDFNVHIINGIKQIEDFHIIEEAADRWDLELHNLLN